MGSDLYLSGTDPDAVHFLRAGGVNIELRTVTHDGRKVDLAPPKAGIELAILQFKGKDLSQNNF